MSFYFDGQYAIHIGQNLVLHKHIKYIEVDSYHVCDDIHDGLMVLLLLLMLQQMINMLILLEKLLEHGSLSIFYTS